MLSDEEVVDRVRAGETSLYGILFERHHRRLYSLTRRLLRDEAEAEDATQEAHLKALTRLDQFAARSSFAKWLTTVAVNEALSRIRRRARRQMLAISDSTTEEPAFLLKSQEDDPEQQAIASESSAWVSGVLGSLPETYRAVFIRRELDEMSTAETASRLGLSDQCVKTRLYRARLMLKRKRLKPPSRTDLSGTVYTC